MSSTTFKPQFPQDGSEFLPVPDPWDFSREERAAARTYPQVVPLDPDRELSGAPVLEVIMPEGIPGALELPEPKSPVRSASAILLEDEMKVADRADDRLRANIEKAIAYLQLAKV